MASDTKTNIKGLWASAQTIEQEDTEKLIDTVFEMGTNGYAKEQVSGGINENYETAEDGLTWNQWGDFAVPSHNSNSTIPSWLYVTSVNYTNEWTGMRAWAPAGAFDARTRVAISAPARDTSVGLLIANTAGDQRVLVQLTYESGNSRFVVGAYTRSGSSYTQTGTTRIVGTNDIYLRIDRDGSNNMGFYYSTNGIMWTRINQVSFTMTVNLIGYRAQIGWPDNFQWASDWLKTNV